jgi:hypothetical protein
LISGTPAVDAILSGIGGLGSSPFEGINRASTMHQINGGMQSKTSLKVRESAISTVCGLWGAAEMTYKALASRPSRFITVGIG